LLVCRARRVAPSLCPISAMTKEFMDGFNIQNMNDALAWTMSDRE
jgi:hypothetical protein